MYHLFRFFAFFATLLLGPFACADDLTVGSLNCYLCFKPGAEYHGQLQNKGPADQATYQSKITNLSTLVGNANVVGLQEIGSAEEAGNIASAMSAQSSFVQGRDTYTGENVAGIYNLPHGYKFVSAKRVPVLDARLSKHLLVTIQGPTVRFHFLIVHLLVANRNQDKNALQRAAVDEWLTSALKERPADVFVILGDFNYNHHGTVLQNGSDCLALINYPATHNSGLVLDHIIVAGAGHIVSTEVKQPPIGNRPNNLNRMLWTAHYAVVASIKSN